MFTRQQLIDSLEQESAIIRHLAQRLPEGTLDYRPSPAQRSTLELLRYLTWCAIVPARFAVTESWEHAAGYEEATRAMTLEQFDDCMARQEQELKALILEQSDDRLLNSAAYMPWGAPCKVGEGLVNMCLKCLVAYRMQLFLYAKACGAEIGPSNCWAGMDIPR